ncbi:MAG: nucleotidyl transferase AbiEii/AbiGii toxin family protein [Candidatus Peregrinibacteria bacterium]
MTVHFSSDEQKVLTPEQCALAPLCEEFSKTHILVGGTAIALLLYHRRSIDFDFFSFGPQGTGKELFARFQKTGLAIDSGSFFPYLSQEEEPEISFFVNGVKFQILDFSRNPFGHPIRITPGGGVGNGIPVPSLLDLSALKLYAMMYRKKWKDAVDLFFLIKKTPLHFNEIVQRTETLFGPCFRIDAALENILENTWDTRESVEYICENPPLDGEVSEFLIHTAKSYIRTC